MNWMREIRRNPEAAELMDNFIELYGTDTLVRVLQNYINSQKQYICRTRTSLFKINTDDILYLQITGHNISIYTETGIYTKYGSLNEETNLLRASGFARCNQSSLVALSKIKSVENNYVLMKNGTKLHISRNYSKNFISAYIAFQPY